MIAPDRLRRAVAEGIITDAQAAALGRLVAQTGLRRDEPRDDERFDLADPARVARRTDIAFLLHLLAAPLIVHPILWPLTAGGGLATTLVVLASVIGLAGVALDLDRRAVLVSGLVYAGIAVGALIGRAGFSGNTAPLRLLTLGAFILALGAGWHPLRARLPRALSQTLAARLPHPIGA